MSLVKKLQPGGDITNPTIQKSLPQKKIKLNIDGQEREFDQEDIDSMYSNILGGLDEKNREYGRQYLEKINTALQTGNAKVNVGGKAALKMEVDPSIGYQQENQMYSEQELKKMYPNKSDRQSFKERSNVIQGIHRQLGDLVAQKYSGIKDVETAKIAEAKKNASESLIANLNRSRNFGTSVFGESGAGDTGLHLSLQSFAKMNQAQRQNALKKWIGGYAQSIYNLDDKNEDLNKTFKEKYGYNISEMKAKLSPYFQVGKFSTSANLADVSDVLQNRLDYNMYFDKHQLARWKAGQFGQVADQTVPATTPETTIPSNSSFTGIKDGARYDKGQLLQGSHDGKYYVKGKLFTGYASPNITKDQSGNVNYSDVYNESKYGAFIGGKRMSDTEFKDYYNKLTPEQKKQFTGYENAKIYMYSSPSSYLNLFSVPNEKGSIAPFLRSKGHQYAQDLTTQYVKNVMPDSRIVSVYDKEKAIRAGTPWAKNISYYRVFKGKNNMLQYEPVKMERSALGFDTVILSNGRRVPLGESKDSGVTQEDFKLPGYKSGGEIKKLAQGGLPGLVINEGLRKGQKQSTKDVLASRASKQATLGDVSKVGLSNIYSTDQLSSADKYKLGALGADMVSLVAGLAPVPGGNFVSGAAGLAGTVSSAIADGSDKEGFTLGDFGKAAGGVGLDLLTMIPGAGLGAKVFKLTRTIKGSANTLKAASIALKAAGYADAGRAVYKLFESGGDPSKMNIDDMRSAINGIKMVTLGFKGTARAKTIAPTQEVKSFSIKNKEGEIFTTKLSAEDEIKFSQLESPIERNAFLKSLAKKQHNIENIDSYGVMQDKSLTPFRSEGKTSWKKPFGKTSSPLITSKNEVQNENLTEDGAIGLNWVRRKLYGKKQMAQDYAYFNKTKQGVPPEKAAAEAKNEVDKIEEGFSTTQQEPDIASPVQNIVTTPPAIATQPQNIVVASTPIAVTSNPNKNPLIMNPLMANYSGRQGSVPEQFNAGEYLTRFARLRQASPELINSEQRQISIPYLQKYVSQNNQSIKDSKKLISSRFENQKNIIDYKTQPYNKRMPRRTYHYKDGGEILFAKNGIKSLIQQLQPETTGMINRKSLNEIRDVYVNKTPTGVLSHLSNKIKTPGLGSIKGGIIDLPMAPDYKNHSKYGQELKESVERKNVMARKLTELNRNQYEKTVNPHSKLNVGDTTFGLDLARTLAGNIANQQFDQTVVTPQYQNVAESYLAAPSTNVRDAATIAAQQYINRRPQTSDQILNQKIQMSNLDKANRLKLQGESEYSNDFEQSRQRNAALSQEYAQQRASIANQNTAAYADAENKRIQLANTVRGLNAENVQNFATRWITKSEQDKMQNKSINTELALNTLANQTSQEQGKLLNRYNYLTNIEASGQLTPELQSEKDRLEKQYSAYNSMTKNISLNIYKNPDYQYNILEEKKKVGLNETFKQGGLLQIENKYNLRRVDDINKSLQTKYNLTVKNNLELLKDILKSTHR